VKRTSYVYWAAGSLITLLTGACSDTATSVDDAGETVDSGTSGLDVSSTAVDSRESSLGDSRATTTNASSSGAQTNAADSGAQTTTWSATSSEPDTGIGQGEAGTCRTASAIAALPEGEDSYVVDGDEACAGNQGCMQIDVESLNLSCGSGGYHCSACNDELCVELYYYEECDGPPAESDAGSVEAGSAEAVSDAGDAALQDAGL
jgi:hypothetical protein